MKLTDKQKKQIIADYVEIGSYRAVAKKFGVSDKTVKSIVNKDPELAQKSARKKEENIADILAHMESKKGLVNKMVDSYLAELLDPVRIRTSTTSQLSTALGTIIDKFTLTKTNMTPNNDRLSHLASIVEGKLMPEKIEPVVKDED